MIVTPSGSGSNKYGAVIIVMVVGYGYIWWKGWKLSDMMFATRRGLSDAITSVSKQLESVYSSISATKRHLSSRIDRVDSKLEEGANNMTTTREEVCELRGDVKLIGADFQTVHHVVRSLETKISRIEGKQNETNFGLGKLIAFVRKIENNKTMDQIEVGPSGSSRPLLELPQLTPQSRAESLPANLLPEVTSSFVSSASHKQPLESDSSASGLKELHGMSDEGSGQTSSRTSIGVHTAEETNNERPGSGLLGRRFPGFSTSFLARSRSGMPYFK